MLRCPTQCVEAKEVEVAETQRRDAFQRRASLLVVVLVETLEGSLLLRVRVPAAAALERKKEQVCQQQKKHEERAARRETEKETLIEGQDENSFFIFFLSGEHQLVVARLEVVQLDILVTCRPEQHNGSAMERWHGSNTNMSHSRSSI